MPLADALLEWLWFDLAAAVVAVDAEPLLALALAASPAELLPVVPLVELLPDGVAFAAVEPVWLLDGDATIRS